VLPDCDDNEPATYPGAMDIWGDGVDQDCDGVDPSAYGFSLGMTLDATGGAAGGTATVTVDFSLIDVNQDVICNHTLDFPSDYGFGPNQGPDLWSESDEVITFTSFQQTGGTCEPGAVAGYMYETDPVVEWEFFLTPMSFVSCHAIQADAALAQSYCGEDLFGLGGDGSFGSYCNVMGPAMQSALGSGPIEAVWLIPGAVGAVDTIGNFSYFIPPSQANVEAYFVMGMLMADAVNPNEPGTTGLEGSYLGVPYWMWIIS